MLNSPSRRSRRHYASLALLASTCAAGLWLATACSDALPNAPAPGVAAPPATVAAADLVAIGGPADLSAGDLGDDVDASTVGDTSTTGDAADATVDDDDAGVDMADLVAADARDTMACSSDADCDDGDPCNGVETCGAMGCVRGDRADDGTRFCVDGGDSVRCEGMGGSTPSTCGDGCNEVTGACIEARVVTLGANADEAGGCEDVSFDDDTPNTNSDSGTDGNGHRLTADSFIWLRFDASRLPEGATVTNARLELWSQARGSTGDGARPTAVSLAADSVAAQSWDQSTATWNAYDGSNAWTGGNDGGQGDRDVEVVRVDVDPDPVDQWFLFELGPDGATRAAERAGLGAMVLNVWGAGGGHDRQYMSCEGPDGLRPRLVIDYEW